MRPLQVYHLIWLAAHPNRDEAWLRRQLVDGFDIHHLDGDHHNNAPENLVLIECSDHLMLHNGGHRINRLTNTRRGPRKLTKRASKALSEFTRWRQQNFGGSRTLRGN